MSSSSMQLLQENNNTTLDFKNYNYFYSYIWYLWQKYCDFCYEKKITNSLSSDKSKNGRHIMPHKGKTPHKNTSVLHIDGGS